MLRKITFFSMILVLSLTMVSGMPSYAKSKDEVKQELATAKEHATNAQADYEAKKATEAKIAAEITNLERNIASTEADLVALEGKIAENNAKITNTEADLAEMEQQVDQQNDDLSERLRMMYESGDGSLIEVLLGSEDVTDFLGGLDIVKKIHASDMEVLDELNVKLAKIEKKKTELNEMKGLLKTHQDSQIQKSQLLAEDKKKLVAAKAKAHKDTEDAFEDLAAAQRDSDALENQLKNFNSKVVWSGPQKGNGRFKWPCNGYVTSEFGPRRSPGGIGSTNHQGIDISVPTGTPILASGDGQVYLASWYFGYGNAVIIDHGGGIMTLYGHNTSFAVSVGQTVKQGDVIAYAGSTGNSTGPHCHFEVRVNGTPQNPRGWL